MKHSARNVSDRDSYRPTPEQIEAETARLKKSYTPTLHWKRTHDLIPYVERHYTFPRVGR